MPDLLGHYLRLEGGTGLLGCLVGATNAVAGFLHKDHSFQEVLFGGIVSSIFSILQFVFAPIWGSLSDRRGRRPVLLWTVAGTSFGYLLWLFSGSFWLFLMSRVVCGAFGGNLSVATAAVADVTTREERSKAMGIVGAAFGLGLITGPALGALAMHWNPFGADAGASFFAGNPFYFPALLALSFSLLNLVWIGARFKETAELGTARRDERPKNALASIFAVEKGPVRRINLVAFVFSVAFVAMEMTLTFLAAERFGYTAAQNGMLLAFMGFCSVLTQGVIVRRLFKKLDELKVLEVGLAVSVLGLAGLALATHPWMLYGALGLSALGSGLVNPSTTGLISLYAAKEEQGRVLGVFRSLGALSRAVTPVVAGALYWIWGSVSLYLLAAGLAIWALLIGRSLPKPQK